MKRNRRATAIRMTILFCESRAAGLPQNPMTEELKRPHKALKPARFPFSVNNDSANEFCFGSATLGLLHRADEPHDPPSCCELGVFFQLVRLIFRHKSNVLLAQESGALTLSPFQSIL
jgi:hypothetical protein